MNPDKLIKNELKSWGKFERILFPLIIVTIAYISLILKDNPIALCSAICGISYTILAGKGKIFCYAFGIAATICYCTISFQNLFYAQFALNFLYYLPMQILGIFQWKKHLKKDSCEIIKTKLQPKESILYFLITSVLAIACSVLLFYTNDKSPVFDAITTTFSILGMLLTIKRCIEQWVVWTIVNSLCTIMWLIAYLQGSNCFATVLMWLTYLSVGIYFFIIWQKELKLNQTKN